MKTITIMFAAVALAIPAAGLADNGGGNDTGAGQLRGLANQLKARVNECKHAPSPAARKECVKHLVSFLQDVKQKIDAVEQTIKEKCSSTPTSGSTTGAPVRNPCARAQQLVDRLEKVKARIDQLIAKFQQGKGVGSSGKDSPSGSSDDPNIAAIESALGSLGP
jgi:hypothetical protein